MKTRSSRQIQLIAWTLSFTVFMLALVAWGQSYDWQLGRMTIYQLFPLFGLVAFSLMWSHYAASALRQVMRLKPEVLSKYFEFTSAVVLGAILLHPGLLAWQVWRDGMGLPPGGYKAYIGAALYGYLLLGAIAWILFLAYELRRFYGKKSWWKFIQYASDASMFLVFFHALRLGGELQKGWFRGVWYFYGISLAAVLLYAYLPKNPRKV